MYYYSHLDCAHFFIWKVGPTERWGVFIKTRAVAQQLGTVGYLRSLFLLRTPSTVEISNLLVSCKCGTYELSSRKCRKCEFFSRKCWKYELFPSTAGNMNVFPGNARNIVIFPAKVKLVERGKQI